MSSCGADIKYGNLTIGNNVFTMATDSEGTGRILADWATNKMGWKSAYALLDTFIEYDKSECRGFVARFKELNGDQSIVLEDTFKNADVSVATHISRYQALPQKPQVMIICSVPPGLAAPFGKFGLPTSKFRYCPPAVVMAAPGTQPFCLKQLLLPQLFGRCRHEEFRPDAEAFFVKYEKRFGERPVRGKALPATAWCRHGPVPPGALAVSIPTR